MRKNPSTSTLLVLGGAGAAAYYFWLRPQLEAQRAAWDSAAAAAGQSAPKRDWLKDILGLGLSYYERKKQDDKVRSTFEAAAREKLTGSATDDSIRAQLHGVGNYFLTER